MSGRWRSTIALAAVVAVHVGAVGIAIWAPSPKTEELILPTVQGILIPAPPAETVQAPSDRETPPPVEPPPPEPEKPKPKPKKPTPKPKPKPEPLPEAPPSEAAMSRGETPSPGDWAAPRAPPAPGGGPWTEVNDSLGAPVAPPPEDAHR